MLLLSVVGALAQNVLRGIVISAADEEPVIGASIVEKGTTNGTVTNLDGRFQISVKQNATIVVSYIGYVTKEITPTGNGEIKVVLSEDNNVLDDVVVVGYGTMRKSDVTGAVSRANIRLSRRVRTPTCCSRCRVQSPDLTSDSPVLQAAIPNSLFVVPTPFLVIQACS